jgi:hypothetical protein
MVPHPNSLQPQLELSVEVCQNFLVKSMEQHALKNVNNFLNTNIYSHLKRSGGQSSNLYLNVIYFFNTSVN